MNVVYLNPQRHGPFTHGECFELLDFLRARDMSPLLKELTIEPPEIQWRTLRRFVYMQRKIEMKTLPPGSNAYSRKRKVQVILEHNGYKRVDQLKTTMTVDEARAYAMRILQAAEETEVAGAA